MKHISRSFWILARHRVLAALVVASCAAVSLGTASATAAARPVPHRAAPIARFEVPRPGAVRLGGPTGAALARTSPPAQESAGGPAGSVVLGGSPGVPLANPKTSTVYVPIQCTTSSCTTPGHVMDILNAAKCNATVISLSLIHI